MKGKRTESVEFTAQEIEKILKDIAHARFGFPSVASRVEWKFDHNGKPDLVVISWSEGMHPTPELRDG